MDNAFWIAIDMVAMVQWVVACAYRRLSVRGAVKKLNVETLYGCVSMVNNGDGEVGVDMCKPSWRMN